MNNSKKSLDGGKKKKSGTVSANIPGKVVTVEVKQGDEVVEGHAVVRHVGVFSVLGGGDFCRGKSGPDHDVWRVPDHRCCTTYVGKQHL